MVNQLVYVNFNIAVLLHQVLLNSSLVLVSLRGSARADIDDSRLNFTVDVIADHLELLSRVDDMGIAGLLKEGKESLGSLVIDLDLLSEDSGGHVIRVGLS